MFRVIFYLLVTIFLITIVRSVVGVVMRGFSELISPAPRQANGAREGVPLSGELKKDPICGTYTSAATSLKETVGKETFYFCSPQCRDKYVASLHA